MTQPKRQTDFEPRFPLSVLVIIILVEFWEIIAHEIVGGTTRIVSIAGPDT